MAAEWVTKSLSNLDPRCHSPVACDTAFSENLTLNGTHICEGEKLVANSYNKSTKHKLLYRAQKPVKFARRERNFNILLLANSY